jgi:sec-independent protein translocase protein TatC
MPKFFKSADPNTEMSFLDHLEALRWHLVRSVAVILVLAIVAFIRKDILFDGIIFALKRPDFPTYRFMCWLSDRYGLDLCITDFSFSLISINLSGQFTTHMFVAFVAGLVLGMPYLLWEIWRFVKPALSGKEKKYSRGIVFFTSFLFITGVLFGYYVISPMSINFLGSYQVSAQVVNQINLDSYISTITILTLASGVIFELPMVVYFLSKLGVVTPKFMRHYRKHSMVVILIVAALITPSPDVTSQMLVAIPLFLLYEISIFISAAVVKKGSTVIS